MGAKAVAVDDGKIGMAQPCGTDTDQNLVAARRREVEFLDPQRAALRIGRRNRARIQDGGANLHGWAPVSVSAAIPTGEGAAVKA